MKLFRSNRTLKQWLDEYALSHQNAINEKIHWFCVPAIFYSIIGFVRTINPKLSSAAILVTLFFYFRISIKLMLAMSVVMAVCVKMVDVTSMSVWSYLGLFIVAWIGQFVGHFVFEGKKPSFFKDLQFLLIGPAWVSKTLAEHFLGKKEPSAAL